MPEPPIRPSTRLDLSTRKLTQRPYSQHNNSTINQLPPHTPVTALTGAASGTATIAIPSFDATKSAAYPNDTRVLSKAENTDGTEMNLYSGRAANTSLKPFIAPVSNINRVVRIGNNGVAQAISNMQPFFMDNN